MQMVVELIGGPMDGARIARDKELPQYVIVRGHEDGPIYRAGCCRKCGGHRTTRYYFLGYEQTIKYEYPEKSHALSAIEQENCHIPNSESKS